MTELTPEAKALLGALDKKHLENIEAIQRVRELHKQIDGIGVKVCAVCVNDQMYWTEQTEYPCETIEALDGEQ